MFFLSAIIFSVISFEKNLSMILLISFFLTLINSSKFYLNVILCLEFYSLFLMALSSVLFLMNSVSVIMLIFILVVFVSEAAVTLSALASFSQAGPSSVLVSSF